ncbi:MAG: carbohydrate kinase family protein [Burkholderiales bacterium]|jgi:adenosine kinase|nr:carbohydrate kinase family protein [Burkholderiales bacterium]
MRTLICGSVAYDTIMVFPDRFRNHILPDQLHILNVAFLVPDMRREFGGTAANIAYSLKLLGADPVVMATVGQDFGDYATRFANLGIGRTHVRTIDGQFTAQAFITTDLDDNQITAFHPGAMNFAHENRVADAGDVRLGIVAPDGRQGMIDHAAQFAAAGIPFVFDPGQGLPMFDGDALRTFIGQATYVAANDYEAKLIEERTGESIDAIARRVKAFIVTRGGDGSWIWVDGTRHEIPSVKAAAIVDPTGCGDSYRAGLLYGIANGLDWSVTGRLASLIGAIKIAHRGAQNHRFSRDEIATRYREAFGHAPW